MSADLAATVSICRARSRSYDVARTLLVATLMKLLISVPVVLAMLCGPALAQPAPPAAQPQFTFKISVKNGADTRSYDLVLEADRCGSVLEHNGDRTDEIKLCAFATQQGARLEAQWKLHAGPVEHGENWTAHLARGQKMEVGRNDGIRFTLAMT